MRRDRRRAVRINAGTFASVIRQFMLSPDFTGLQPSTRRTYGTALTLAERPELLGAVPVDVIRPALIQAFLDGLADRPGNQKVARTALKSLEAWALVRDLLPYPIMTGTYTASGGDGHEPWSFEHVAIAERHARPDLAKVVTLAVHTGQRGSDIVRMRPTDIEEKEDPATGVLRLGINVTQQKTGRRLWVPFTAELVAAVATWERRPGPYILKPDGKPYTRELLSWHWNHERDHNEALGPLREAGLVLHGLRATAVVRARKAGASPLQIASMFGMSEPMVARYSRLADQSEMAMAAVHYLDRTAVERATQIKTKTAR